MQNEIEEAIKHAVLANHDGDLRAIAIVMITANGMPEVHMRCSTDFAFNLNAGVDILKDEVKIMMHKRMENMGPRK